MGAPTSGGWGDFHILPSPTLVTPLCFGDVIHSLSRRVDIGCFVVVLRCLLDLCVCGFVLLSLSLLTLKPCITTFEQECDQVHIDDVSSDDNGQDLRYVV